MSRLLVIAFRPEDGSLIAGFAEALALPYDVLFLGAAGAHAGERAFTAGLAETPPADNVAKSLAEFARAYTHVASVSTMQAKDVLARVAGVLDAAMLTDVIAVESPAVFHRPMVAGAVIGKVEALTTPIVLTVRPAGFAKPTVSGGSEPETVSLALEPGSRRIAVSSRGGGRPDLAQAKVVVSGGRPLKDADTFEKLIGGTADVLGGAAGATRAAVDSGIAPNELQVGQTGKNVAPDLYIAAGVSGSTQHMAGIKDSKVIVAINKDPDAPIFEFADYGLVADLYDALPALQAKVRG